MSQFRRQSINHFIISIIALALGALNNLYIYTHNLALKGQYDFIINTAYILGVILSLGLPMISNKYLPVFKTDDDKDNGYLSFLLLLTFVSAVTAVILIYPVLSQQFVFHDFLKEYRNNKVSIISVTVCTIFITVTSKYLFAKKTVDLPLAIINLLNKVYVGAVIWGISHQLIAIQKFDILVRLWFFIAVILLILLIYYKHKNSFSKFNFDFISSKLGNDFRPFLISAMFMSISYSVLDKIDLSMIGAMLTFKENGIYGILSYLSGIILIPYISVYALFGYKIAEYSHEGKIGQIKVTYEKTSDYLLTAGMILTLAIWSFIPLLPEISPKMAQVTEYKNVFLLLAAGHLINMIFSINEHIIVYSKYHLINVVLVVMTLVLNVILNYVLIPKYTLYGAAIATGISLGLFNILKSIFIYHKMNLQPFSPNTIKLLSLGTICFYSITIISFQSEIVNLCFKLLLILVLLIIPVFVFNLSGMITENTKDILRRYMSFGSD